MRILYLILAGGDSSHLKDIVTTRQTWLSDLPNSDNYFEMYADPKLAQGFIKGHELWVNCGAEYSDILRKTILSLRMLGDSLEAFDFIIRTNVSSYFDHGRIREVLSSTNTEDHFYGGYIGEYKNADGSAQPYVSGSAVFWSSKTAKLVSTMEPNDFDGIPDDIAFAKFLSKKKVSLSHIQRGNICMHNICTLSSHYRLKSSTNPELASLRMNFYYKLSVTDSNFKKLGIIFSHQIRELIKFEFTVVELGAYIRRIRQVIKIQIKY